MDALFYWLQMKLVSEQRPDDQAARETIGFFTQILSEDHGISSYRIDSKDEAKVYVTYITKDGNERTVWFDREAAEMMLNHPVMSKAEKQAADNQEGTP